VIHQSPEKERTEEEKTVDQLLGPAQKFDLEVATPPGISSISSRFKRLFQFFRVVSSLQNSTIEKLFVFQTSTKLSFLESRAKIKSVRSTSCPIGRNSRRNIRDRKTIQSGNRRQNLPTFLITKTKCPQVRLCHLSSIQVNTIVL